MKGDRTLVGKLMAFDQHLNLILGACTHAALNAAAAAASETSGACVVESIEFSVPEDAATSKMPSVNSLAPVNTNCRTVRHEMLFVRGDCIILISPAAK